MSKLFIRIGEYIHKMCSRDRVYETLTIHLHQNLTLHKQQHKISEEWEIQRTHFNTMKTSLGICLQRDWIFMYICKILNMPSLLAMTDESPAQRYVKWSAWHYKFTVVCNVRGDDQRKIAAHYKDGPRYQIPNKYRTHTNICTLDDNSSTMKCIVTTLHSNCRRGLPRPIIIASLCARAP